MKTLWLCLLLVGTAFAEPKPRPHTCAGAWAICTACRDCTKCGYCAKQGGECSVKEAKTDAERRRAKENGR